MKKSFFKKLSFVMAAAMTMSLVAPAAGAFAATAPKLNSAKKYLYLDVEDKNDYNFNITTTKGKGWNYVWESSDEDVAVVDESNGVTTATGVGSAKITVFITDKDGEEVGDASATVIVKDNIKDLAIANKPEKDTVAVDQPFDFNRTFTTVSGSTTVTSSVTRWTVTPADGATITDAGVFTATKAGEYTVKAFAFQSKEKYTTWKADPTANAALVLASAETKVTVGVSIKGVKLVTPTQLAITFDSSVKDKVTGTGDVKVDLKLTDTLTSMVPVWKFDSVSEDGKTVTISTYDALTDKQTYKVSAAGATFELYAQIGTPVSISMADQTIAANSATVLAYTLLDQYGVNVATKYDGNVVKNSTVPFTVAATGSLTLANDQVAFVEYNYTITNSDGTTKTISTGTKTVKGVAASVGSTLEWNIVASEDFTKTTQSIKVMDAAQGLELYGRVKKSDGTYTSSANYTFESLNQNILVIDANGNGLTPVAAGTALVKVTDKTNNNALVTYINVTVLAKPATATVKASATNFTLSNSITNATPEAKTVNIINVDQYGTETAASIDAGKSYVLNAGRTTDIVNYAVGASSITFTAAATKTGSFNYLVTTTEGKTVTITVSVVAPGTLSSYSITASQTSVDAYKANGDTAHTVAFTVYGVDVNGIKKELVLPGAVSGQTITYSITNPDGTAQLVSGLAGSVSGGVVTFNVDDTEATNVEKVGTYTFTVSIKDNNSTGNGIQYAQSFTVTNSRPAPALTIKALSTTAVNGETVISAVDDLIGLKLNDTKADLSAVEFISNNSLIVASNGSNFSAANDGTVSLYITKVKTIAGGVEQTVDINASFTVKVQ